MDLTQGFPLSNFGVSAFSAAELIATIETIVTTFYLPRVSDFWKFLGERLGVPSRELAWKRELSPREFVVLLDLFDFSQKHNEELPAEYKALRAHLDALGSTFPAKKPEDLEGRELKVILLLG